MLNLKIVQYYRDNLFSQVVPVVLHQILPMLGQMVKKFFFSNLFKLLTLKWKTTIKLQLFFGLKMMP